VNFIYYNNNRLIRNIIKITINLNSIILGIILSDGHKLKNKNKKKQIIHYSHLNKLLIDSSILSIFDLFLINFLIFVRVILD
jgi:hypothetical protein